MTSKLKFSFLLTSAAVLSAMISASASADPQKAQAQANFLAADVNKDEKLDLAEFTAFINLNADHNLGRAATIRRLGMYGRAFKEADANGDAAVSKQEIAARADK